MKTINLATISIGALTILLLAIASLLIHPLVVLGAFTLIALLCGLVWLARHRAPSFRKAVAYANLGLAGVCLLVWLMNMLGLDRRRQHRRPGHRRVHLPGPGPDAAGR